MHRKAPVFNNSRQLTSVKFRQIPISFVFFVLVVFNTRWLAVLYAAASIGSMLLYIEYYEQSKIIFQWVLQAVLLLLLFNPPANRYFAAQDSKE